MAAGLSTAASALRPSRLDCPGQRVGTHRPGPRSYGYDGANRLATLTSPAGTFTYQYFVGWDAIPSPSPLVQKLLLPNGAYITNGFDQWGRLLETTLKNSTNAVLNSLTYSLNQLNQRTMWLASRKQRGQKAEGSSLKNQKWLEGNLKFRVEPAVARRLPHRPVLAVCPHTVLQKHGFAKPCRYPLLFR